MAKKSYDQINAEILDKLDILSEYAAMGVRFAGEPRPSGKVSCYAVGREDRSPSAWVDLKTGRYGDSGGAAAGVPRSLSLWDFAAQFGGQPDWQTARREFAQKVGVRLGKSTPAENWRDRLELQSWDEPGNIALAQRWCVTKKKGITVDAIRAAGGQMAYYPCYRDEKTGELKRRSNHVQVIALPAYGERLLDADPVAWVIWDCTGADLEVYRGKDVPKSSAKMLSIGPTSGTLMGLHGLARLADEELRASVRRVHKTGGPTDMLAMWASIPSDRRDQEVVITNASGESGSVLAWQTKILAGLPVAVVHDTDTAGEAGTTKWCRSLCGIASTVFVCPFPWKTTDSHGHDFRDFVNGVPLDGVT